MIPAGVLGPPNQIHKKINMNIKRIFGTVLTILGIAGLIYTAILFVNNNSNGMQNFKILITYGVLGLVFFASGIGLVKTTKDES